MKTACFIYSDNKKYDKLQECAVRSFKKFCKNVIKRLSDTPRIDLK